MPNTYAITCCSTADMPASYMKEHQIPYACFHFRMEDQDYDDDLGASIPIEKFYQKIREGAMPVTSQVNPGQYEAMFEPILKEGRDIIHLTLSSGISGTYNSALIARDELLERYPDRRIRVIDSLGASCGYGLLVDAAWQKRQEGMGFEELADWIEANKLRVHHWFFTSDLTHLRRGGRISASAAFFGNMLNICPILNINSEGKLIPRDKCRGKKKAIRQLMEQMKLHAENGTDYAGTCYILHSSCEEDAKELSELIRQTFPHVKQPVPIFSIGTVIGSHTGPGTVAAIFWGDERGA
ncbi:MAG: DegV family protein [Clostridiales bacterium]|nr:DegV family protein [Clostridiales bacterium]